MRGARGSTRRRARDERGAVAVEFAIIAPILILLVLGIIEFGFGYHAWDSTQNAAREGARVAAVDNVEANIRARTASAAGVLDQSNLVILIECGPPPAGPFVTCDQGDLSLLSAGDVVRVTVDYSYNFMTPLPNLVGLGSQMDMSSVAEARFEGV
jgi:hypothetical protein